VGLAGFPAGESKTSPMIKAYSKSLGEFIGRGDAIVIAAAFLIALAIYSFLQTLMEGLIAPAIAALFDKPDIYVLSFTINGSDFRYGTVLVGLILLVLVVAVVAVVGKVSQGAKSNSTET
jgi:large conductance mechanosensitive channel